jgi:hypothetical protein
MKTARQRLEKRGIAGFHSFRRYRITHLRELGVPEDITRYWAGHEGRGITDRYSQLALKSELRKDWAVRAGLGFDLPEMIACSDPSPRLPEEPATLAKDIVRYQATDDDLPIELFESSTEMLAETK